MARLARVVAAGAPHHVIQRGNRGQKTFFRRDDYEAYLELMAEWCASRSVDVWAYCLMPNHVHLIVVPQSPDALRLALGEAHRRYTRRINTRKGWRGHLWQGRFASYAMDSKHVMLATKYVELTPVREGLEKSPEDYRWSSAAAHRWCLDDPLMKPSPVLDKIGCWRRFLEEEMSAVDIDLLQRHERTGRPLGSKRFVSELEKDLDRVLQPQRPGRKPKIKKN